MAAPSDVQDEHARSASFEREGWVPLEQDRPLLDGFRSGDRSALQEVFKRYLPVVMRALRGGARAGGGARLPHGLDEMELENLAHDTFVRAFSDGSRERYDGIRPYAAYLATIAKNLIIDEARKRGRRPVEVALEDAQNHLGSDLPSPEEEATASTLKRRVEHFKAGLTDDLRLVFEVRFEQQLSLRAAAKRTGLRLFALRKLDVQIRLALLDQLKTDGFLEHVDVEIGASVLNRSPKRAVNND